MCLFDLCCSPVFHQAVSLWFAFLFSSTDLLYYSVIKKIERPVKTVKAQLTDDVRPS